MSFFAFIVPLLLVSTSLVKQGFAYNVGHVTIPLFEMLVKNLPQNEIETADDYTNLEEYYNKLKILDAWKANPALTLKIILRDKATTVITDGRTLHERETLKTETLFGYNCTRWCYNVTVPQILNVTGWSVDQLDGKVFPYVRLGDIHNAVVKAIEKRFCCNMTAIAIQLNIDNGVELCAPYINVWEKFVPHITNATIKCKADELSVTTAELAELLRTTLTSLLSYDLHQLDSNFFPLYEDLLNRKNLFETKSIITGVVVNAPATQWESETMSLFASIVSQFTVRDLEILYRWRTPQLFAIQNIPMSIYMSGCNTIALTDSLFKLSETLFGFPNKLPPCDVAFLLARTLNEVNTKFTVASIDNQNVLEIFRNESKIYSWFVFYQLLQLKIDDGIWIETPRLSQVAVYSGQSGASIKENSIPQVVSVIQNFNNSGILNIIMASNYASFLTKLLDIYGYSAEELAQAAGITQTQLNSLTIQRAHSYILTSVSERYDIDDLASAFGVPGVNFYVLTNLPSFEWDRILRGACQAAFNHSANAFSVKLAEGGAQVTTVKGGFPSIQVSDSATYHTNRTSPSKLAYCINQTLFSFCANTFTEYHQLFNTTILPLYQIKLVFETQSMESLLVAKGLQFADVEGKSVAEVITQLTGLTTANIACLYPWSSTFISTDLGKTFANANATRLCGDFLGLSLYNIVVNISETADKICFFCQTLKPCLDNAVCTDIPNAFICTCNKGYTGDGINSCADILECKLNLDTCHDNATCQDTSGSYQCTCKSGFLGNGEVCQDTDECSIIPNRCGAKGICVNTIGSYYCRCETGYQWNGTACVDINECTTNTHNCHTAAICNNTIGSFSCACNSGLTGDGVLCVDILECNFQAGLYPCHAKAKCTEVFASYRCECNAGYTGDGKDCDDINECNAGTHDCDTNAVCFNAEPGFVCQCKTGFTGNGTTCSDIKECATGLDNCHKDANCINTVGSFTCDCKDGFNGNGTYCYVAQVSFVKNAHVVTEGGNVTVTISLSGAIDSTAVVSITLGGTATKNVDYTTSPAAVLFQVNGPTTKTVTITTIEDTKLEATETITLTLSSSSNHVVPGGIVTTIVTIADDDAVTVTLSSSTYNVNERDGIAPVVVQINSGTVEREIIVSVTTVSSGSATTNVDYTPHTQEIRFSPGNVVAQLVRIPITNDNLTESNEQFTVLLSTTDKAVNLLTKTATVIIQDNDVSTVKFEKSSYSVGEGSNITVKVLLIGSLAIHVTARLTVSDAGAVRDNDYRLPGNLDVTFVPNGPTSALITFVILQDPIVENNENFVVTLSSQSLPSLVVVTPVTTAITIIDDDVLSVSFVPTTYSTPEENSVAKVNLVVIGTFEKSLVLSISTANNTAKAGEDYVALVASSLIFNVGDPQEKEVSVQILEDNHIEGTESFYIQMSSSDAKITFPNGTQAQIDIVDDDVAIALIPLTSYSFQEGATPTRIPVVLTGSLAIPVTVRLSTVHDTAKWPSDFTAISNFEIEFTPSGPRTEYLTLDIKEDAVVEGTERFYVDLTATSSYVSIGTFKRTSVFIRDTDELRVRFSSNHYTADENLRYAQVGLVLDKVLETNASVRLTPFNGTATAPEDFPLITYDVTLDPGQPRTVYYKINITDDMLEEYSEHFFVSLTALSSNVKTAQPDVANITIAESDDVDFCDPNAKRYPCHIKADCVDVPGSYVCTCITGYQGNGLNCKNINECNTTVCPFNATCQDTLGSYKCICQSGYVGDGVDCRDIDECADKKDDCHAQATCTNTLGSFECRCNAGYEGNGKVCTDINECERFLDNCHANATCVNTNGSFQCTCLRGFRGNGVQCVDINECTETLDNCHNQATCANTNGSFTCTCKPGYSGDGITCPDINECISPTHDCHVNASCTNMPPGSFSCACFLPGFEGDGRSCADINECDRNTDNCPTNSVCRNTIGSFFCECSPGFTHNGSVCVDDDECNGVNNCHSDAYCVNEPGSYRCVCKKGFTGNGTSCTNLDECKLNPGTCHEYANCTDTHGSFECTCTSGFTGNGTYCEDMIDCIFEPRKYPCDVRATCTDVPGGFTCTCPGGFSLNADKQNCDDVNECKSASTFTCHVNASCVNVDGSYNCKCKDNFVGDGKTTCVDTTCSTGNPCSSDAVCSVNVTTHSYNCVCNPGFSGDGKTCNDTNECNIQGKCGANTNCVNQPRGSFTCTCKLGFSGDPYRSCNDIDECLNNPCHANWANCTNYPGGHACVCNLGFTGNGINCEDIDECKDPSTCDSNADCKNRNGSHTCTCRKGYTGDGKTCRDIDECLNNPCHAWAKCNNYPGRHTCVCNPGFTGTGFNCEDIDECESKPCEIGANCVNNPGSYQCVCPEDLYRNGNFCHVFCPFKLDLAFIVDTSQSIIEADFLKVKNFLTESVAKMEIGENGNHIAAIAFGNIAEVFMYFNTISGQDLTRAAVINKLSNFTQLGGLTRIDLALLTAESNVFTQANGMRTSDQIRKVAVVITDGKQTTGPGVPVEPLEDIAKRLQANDITILAIGVGAQVPRHQMLNITNSIEENILEVNSFDNLISVIFQFINMSCTDIDECKRYNPCHVNANCKDTLGAYSCLCKIGYSGNGFQCQDVDECASGNSNPCPQNAKCNNTDGSYTCTCNGGYAVDGRQCQDINECIRGTHNCHSNATCSNEQGSFSCVCKSGFTGDGSSCTNINECLTGPCHRQHASCKDNDGSYTCKCNAGYAGDGKTCTDVDECASANSSSCHQKAKCNNTDGSYTCTCNSGYTGDGRQCKDIDECTNGGNNCSSVANCTNLEGSFKCVCRLGYTGDGVTCTDVQCNLDCGTRAICVSDVMGGFKCECRTGFTGNGTTCADVNECMLNRCHVNANCTNIDGSFTCTCKTGYNGNGSQCQDVDECASGNSNSGYPNTETFVENRGEAELFEQTSRCLDILMKHSSEYIKECITGAHNCHSNADCINTQGGYGCLCKGGFTGDGFNCTDIRCNLDCDSNAVCLADSMGGFKCVCSIGYTGNGTTCEDVNECMLNRCHVNANCTNIDGSFTCVCKTGYNGNGSQCQDVDECASGNSNSCHQQAKCDNTDGSYTCTCNSGYTGNGTPQCQDINECTTGAHNCHSNANCINNPGSFGCDCKNGFTGNGFTCTATGNEKDECESTSPCGVGQSCKSYVNGSYECFCTSPGKFLQNRTCIDVSTVSAVLKIINELFTAALSEPRNSVYYYTLSNELVTQINKLFKQLYSTTYIGSAITNISNGSVIVNYLLIFQPNSAPSASALSTTFWNALSTANGKKMLGHFIILDEQSSTINVFKDYNECNPSFGQHVKDCPDFSYCLNNYGSYSCECLSGYEKLQKHNMCVTEDDDWWIIYAVVFASILFVVLCLICLFCFLEFVRNKELYTLHDELGNESRLKHDKRIDEEVAPGFPGNVPRSSSTGSQLLLSADKKSNPDSERMAMYEVNPIYDSANG